MDYKKLADDLLNLYIECFGYHNAIVWLIDSGYTKEDICDELGFDEDYYERVKDEEEI